MGGAIALRGSGRAGTGKLLISSEPCVNTRLKSEAASIVWNRLASRQVEAAVDDSHATSVNVFFGARAGVNAVAKMPTEGATLGSCTEEVRLGGGGRGR